MPTVKVRMDYYDITSASGSKGLLKEKLLAVLNVLDESERETQFDTSFLNFDACLQPGGTRIVGSIRILRTVSPRKGKKGTNDTEDLGLKSDEGISEVTHFVYDFEHNKLLIQYNYHGPKVSHFIGMVNRLYKKAVAEKKINDVGSKTRCSYKPIIVGSEIDLVLNSQHISAITARPRMPVSDGSVDSSASWHQLANAYRLPAETNATLVLKNKSGRLKETFRFLLSGRDKIDDYDKLEVGVLDPESGVVETYDLINNRLQTIIDVPCVDGSTAINGEILIEKMGQDFDEKIAQQIGW